MCCGVVAEEFHMDPFNIVIVSQNKAYFLNLIFKNFFLQNQCILCKFLVRATSLYKPSAWLCVCVRACVLACVPACLPV